MFVLNSASRVLGDYPDVLPWVELLDSSPTAPIKLIEFTASGRPRVAGTTSRFIIVYNPPCLEQKPRRLEQLVSFRHLGLAGAAFETNLEIPCHREL